MISIDYYKTNSNAPMCRTDWRFLHRMRSVWRRTVVQHDIFRGWTSLDRTASGDGPVLLRTAAWQESKLVEHKCLSQSKALRHAGI